MKNELYDYVGANGQNDIKVWTEGLQKKERAKLNARLDMLAQHGVGLFPHILTNTPTPGILKLRCHGNVQLRPMLCNGPISVNSEFTLLIGATERDFRFDPLDADSLANVRKQEVNIDPANRRKKHERVT